MSPTGWLTKRRDAASLRWVQSVLKRPEIHRDAMKVLRAISAEPNLMVEGAERLPGFDRLALVVWAEKDRVMPTECGRRLAELLPQGRLVEFEDSDTLIPLDQPTPASRTPSARFTKENSPEAV